MKIVNYTKQNWYQFRIRTKENKNMRKKKQTTKMKMSTKDEGSKLIGLI